MNIIIPMAERGHLLRPHTLTKPKPLLHIAGKSIIQRLVESIAEASEEPIEKIGFVVGDFGKEIENQLEQIAKSVGAEGHILYQEHKMGTAHAILCAQSLMNESVLVVFADTIFTGSLDVEKDVDGIIWTCKLDEPKGCGVVKMNDNNVITKFVEKPEEYVSDMAIIGVYYFRNGMYLKNELQYLLDNELSESGKYNLTAALDIMNQKDTQFGVAIVEEWLDCGNKTACLHTNQRILELNKEAEELISPSAVIENTTVIQPCYIGVGVRLKNSVIGPHVSIEAGTIIEYSIIRNSIIQSNSYIRHQVLMDSMIGSSVRLEGQTKTLNVGDFSTQS
ncbi:MAG: sugar phosphate nucleotidyltransferase [Chitinophagales bacterium]